MAKPKIGRKVKDFTLNDQDGKPFRLGAQRGKQVLLSFHPLAWTGICAQQMRGLEKNRAAFARLRTVAVGVNVDSVPSKQAWAKSLRIRRTRLLADFWPHGRVARQLGLFRKDKGFSERANLLVGRDGKIKWVKVYPIHELPDLVEVLRAAGARV